MTEDLSLFFVDHGVTATPGAGSAFTVIFDRAYISAMGMAGGITGSEPLALAQTADVASRGLTTNSTLVIGGTTYYLQDEHKDGTGLSVLVLSLEAA